MRKDKLLVKCVEEGKDHPHCPHGPTLLFYSRASGPESGYYGCSAYRDKKDCNFHLKVSELTPRLLSKRYEINTTPWKEKREKMKQLNPKQRKYCHTCDEPFFDDEEQFHKEHETISGIQEEHLEDSTKWLHPLNVDKSQAQYFFDEKALKYFVKCFKTFQIKKIICIGAPRLHSYLRLNEPSSMKSFLLDFDRRFFYFLSDREFAWYNMCNNWFFDHSQRQEFKNFLKSENEENIVIFTDPPFGCRTEPLANTIREIFSFYKKINSLSHRPLPLFWIFPYFSEKYIKDEMPELEMCDYLVNYTNHCTYSDLGKKSRKEGSPVRLFTNIPLHLMPLPDETIYKACKSCKRFVIAVNTHCESCNLCPSKNGGRYRHCLHCGQCVKANYKHCFECRRCTQIAGHDCEHYQKHQFCWICGIQGHTEYKCLQWQRICSKQGLKIPFRKPSKDILCLLCGTKGHNEKSCKKRSDFLKESVFLGEKSISFKWK